MSRRAALKGLGATIALPFLDAMTPAGVAYARTADRKLRLIAIEMVHGAAGSTTYGARMNMWAPAATGSAFDLAPTAMASLAALPRRADHHQQHRLPQRRGVHRARDRRRSLPLGGGVPDPGQAQADAGLRRLAGTSLDQIFAGQFGQDSPIPSMQLCIENVDQAGGCSYNYSCVYTDTISWASPTEPLPMIRDPRAVFDQLFGLGTTPAARQARRRDDRSILDFVAESVRELQGRLGTADRARLADYLDDVREIERRIQKVEAQNSSGEARELPGAPIGVPDSWEDHVKLMFDLQAVAFASDVTRVFAFKLSRDVSNRVFGPSGSTTAFHTSSHHQEREDRIRDFQKINAYHVSLLPYLLDRLKQIPDGDGTMLDSSLVVYGSAMGNSNMHNHKRCPLVVAGHAGGRLKGDLHVKAADGTPMANAMLSLLHALDVDVAELRRQHRGARPQPRRRADGGRRRRRRWPGPVDRDDPGAMTAVGAWLPRPVRLAQSRRRARHADGGSAQGSAQPSTARWPRRRCATTPPRCGRWCVRATTSTPPRATG